MIKNKKGTEKPIEIFVALFVILAVALLLLQLFQSQLSDKQRELSDASRKTQAEQTRKQAISHCQSACTAAESDGCSLKALATFCLSYASDSVTQPNFLDLNNDGEMGVDLTTLVGVAVCEDEVPCHALVSQCCARQISPQSCLGFLETYWNNVQLTELQQSENMQNLVRPGRCYDAALSTTHWYDKYCEFINDNMDENDDQVFCRI